MQIILWNPVGRKFGLSGNDKVESGAVHKVLYAGALGVAGVGEQAVVGVVADGREHRGALLLAAVAGAFNREQQN